MKSTNLYEYYGPYDNEDAIDPEAMENYAEMYLDQVDEAENAYWEKR